MAATAAAKVFGIVELLENILIHYAESVDIRKEPATHLFALKRVNTAFHDTIVKKTFAPYMWLEPTTVEPGRNEDLKLAIHGRCAWLFRRLLNPIHIRSAYFVRPHRRLGGRRDHLGRPRGEQVTKTPSGGISCRATRSLDLRRGPPRLLLVRFLRPEASWRKMLMPEWERGHMSIDFEVSPSLEEFVSVLGRGFRYTERIDISISGQCFLGKLCNWYIGLFEADRAEQEYAIHSTLRLSRTDYQIWALKEKVMQKRMDMEKQEALK